MFQIVWKEDNGKTLSACAADKDSMIMLILGLFEIYNKSYDPMKDIILKLYHDGIEIEPNALGYNFYEATRENNDFILARGRYPNG